MVNENTPEYAKALYDHAAVISRGPDFIYAAQLLERLAGLRDPFYTAFALALLEQTYKRLGREDLVKGILKRVIELPKDQQLLLNPSWVASCYQRIGDLKGAKAILAGITQLAPEEPLAAAALAEIALAEGHPDQAYVLSEPLRRRPEPPLQILGKTLGAAALIFQGRNEAAANELSWVGQFLISSGSIPPGAWDYRDLRELLAKGTGGTVAAALVLLDALTGKVPIPEFAQQWSVPVPSPQSATKN
jgi:hypothetical protein